MVVQLAARSIDIPAAVSFYGRMTKFRGRKNLRTEFLYQVPDKNNGLQNNFTIMKPS